jgi:phosphate starvation-inducible PhoH-like protein
MQSAYVQALQHVDLVFGVRARGHRQDLPRRRLCAQCLERGLVDRIVLSRPAVEAGERLGFLPGDMREKVDPYLRPLYDALYDVLPQTKVERDLETGVIEIAPLAFMRGRTLAHAFVILDEAQNTTSMQMKMFLTRIGEGSKMVVTGDPEPGRPAAGPALGPRRGGGAAHGVRGIEAIRFTSGDVVRRDLVARIVEAYDRAG